MRVQVRGSAARRFLLGAAAALPLALSGCLETKAPPFSHVVLYSRTPQGEPVAGVRVEMVGGWEYRDLRATGFTNRSGELRLTVPGDNFVVRVHAPGPEWTPALITQRIHLDDGEELFIEEVFTP